MERCKKIYANISNMVLYQLEEKLTLIIRFSFLNQPFPLKDKILVKKRYVPPLL